MEKLYLGDLHVGQTFESGEHILDAEQIISFAKAYDPQPFHVDAEKAKDSFFRDLAASGWHTAAITMKLVVELVPIANGVIGGGGALQWPTAARAGDILRVRTRIEEIVPSRSRPGRATINAHCLTLNQRDEIRQEFRPRLVAWDRDVMPE